MKLKEIAHTRTGDKGNMSNIAVIPYDEKDYPMLKEFLTAKRVEEFFSEICFGGVRSMNLIIFVHLILYSKNLWVEGLQEVLL